jgi:hypothetical protein
MMLYLVSMVLIATVIGLALLGLAYWLYDRAPTGSRRFGSVRVGSYFTLRASGNSIVVCRKVSRSRYTPLSGPGKRDRVRASRDLPVYNVEDG